MKQKRLGKRIAAVFLCLAMVLTTVNLPVFTKEVKSAPAPTTWEPSVTVFATKTDLVDPNNFTLHTDNGSGVAQKVNFGNGKTWYIAGAQHNCEDGDCADTTPNELVLICDPNKSFDAKLFLASMSEKDYESYMGTYEDATAPTKVSPNHYGASEIRDYLIKLYGDNKVDVFSSAEQKLMKDTTVYTKDAKIAEVYSTSDKLYLAYGDHNDKSYITVGANDNYISKLNSGIKIGVKSDNSPSGSPYASDSSGQFWLRAPYSLEATMTRALYVILGDSVHYEHVYKTKNPVVPAFNMNLSSVLFASAAIAASSNATLSDAMTFRLDGSDKVKSSAVACTGNIYVTKGTNDNEYLYVQGNDGTKDWVYSKKITADYTVTAEDIKSEKTLADIDLTKCKIWIETTDDNVTYAKEIVAQGNHDFTKYVSLGDGKHKLVCKYCDTVLEGHERDACSGGEATCVAKAVCEKCGVEYGEVNPGNHDFDDDGVCKVCEYECTHKNEGVSTFVEGKCSICNYDCVAKEHVKNTNNWLNKNATEHEFACSVCGIVITGNHDFTDQPYTTDEDGIHHNQKCKYCDDVTQGNHDFSAQPYLEDDAGKHYKICSLCDAETAHEAHIGGTATCTKKAVCEVCEKEYGELAAHTLMTTTTKATLTANGKNETKCTVCGKVTKTETIYAAKTIKLSATAYTYDGKAKKPTVTIKDSQGNAIASTNYTVTYPKGRKNVGKYTVKVTFKGDYSGSKNLTFTINPPKTSISKVSAGRKAFTVKWTKKTKQVTGYEIQYSTSKTFASRNKTVKVTSAKTASKTIKSLKAKKTYYVRIRTYKTVNKVKYYSDWSAKKSVTTKK